MDLRKTINSQAPSLINGNFIMPPEGDKPVFYSKTGALLLEQAPTYGNLAVATCANLAAVKVAVPISDIIAGAYWDLNGLNIDPCLFSPTIFAWRCDVSTANSFYNLPTTKQVIDNLKSVIGPENVACGFAWQIKLINTFNHVIQYNAQAGWSYYSGNGFNCSFLGPKGITMLFVITNITPGSEAISIYCS